MSLKKNETVELKNALVSSSEFSLEVFDFVWKLKNFKGTFSRDISSPSFIAPITKNEWRLKIRMASDFVSVALELVCVGNGENGERENCDWIKTEYQMTILDSDEKIAATNGPFDYSEPIYFCQMISRSACSNRAKRYFSDGNVLTILCRISTNHMTHISNSQEKVENGKKLEKPNSKSNLLNFVTGQLKSFFISGEFSDVKIKTKNNSFPASKIILAAQSPVFKSIFNANLKEDEFEVEGFSDDLVKGFLEFVYTGTTKLVKENSAELLKMSHEFGVAQLKFECEKVLVGDLYVENAVEMFILAHFCSSSALKTRVVDFMSRWRKQVEKTTDFEEMKKFYPEILLDLYTQLD